MNARKTASQRSIAELSEVVCIHSLSDSYESEESQGKIDLTLFAVKWNSESTIFITLAHGWIFPFDLIATPQTPPLSGGSTRSDFERLLDLRNLWSALTFLFIYLFFVHYPVGWVFCQWRKHPSKCTKINFLFFFFLLGFKSSEAQALAGRDESSGVFVLLLMQRVCCERSARAAPRASLLSSPVPMLSNITNASPCYIFFGAFIRACLLSKRGDGGGLWHLLLC